MATQLEKRTASQTAIVAAASRAIAERGVDGFTIAEVAEATGLNRATVYHYYPDRNALTLEALRHMVRQHEAAHAEPDGVRVRRRVFAHIESPELARFLFSLMLKREPWPPLPSLASARRRLHRRGDRAETRDDVDPELFPVIVTLAEMAWAIGRESIAPQLDMAAEDADRRLIRELERIVRDTRLGDRDHRRA
jgi:AcrR family transcriptional regulator